MISYDPLRQSLKNLGQNLNELRKKGKLNPRTIAKISKNEPVSLTTIEVICLYYRLPIERVVEIKIK